MQRWPGFLPLGYCGRWISTGESRLLTLEIHRWWGSGQLHHKFTPSLIFHFFPFHVLGILLLAFWFTHQRWAKTSPCTVWTESTWVHMYTSIGVLLSATWGWAYSQAPLSVTPDLLWNGCTYCHEIWWGAVVSFYISKVGRVECKGGPQTCESGE